MEKHNDNPVSSKTWKKHEESRRILERVERESEQVGIFSILRLTDMASKKITKQGEGNSAEDTIEIIGKRIGRTLAVIMFVVLSVSLYLSYIAS